MRERLFRGDVFEYERSRREDFDAMAEGKRYGLAPEVSAALWEHVRREATNSAGLCDEKAARARFAQLAEIIARRGGQIGPEPFRWTRVDVALGRLPPDDPLAARVPGRTTLVLAEAGGAGGHTHDIRRFPKALVPGKQTRVLLETEHHDMAFSEAEEVPHAVDVGAKPATTSSAVARRGVSDAQRALPHGDRIQAIFGRHSLAGVRAQIGGPAAHAARELGARAYAFGDRIAFSTEPDLFQAAHEAAHVIQQRAGLGGRGAVDGGAADPFERHADAVASAVVRGVSAEALLDQVVRTGGSSSALSVQRDSGPARNATWDQVEAAASGDAGKEALDIKWLDEGDTPEAVRFTVDHEFSDEGNRERKANSKQHDKDIIALDAKLKTDLTKLKTDTKRARRAAHQPAGDRDLEADTTYTTARRALQDAHDARKATFAAADDKRVDDADQAMAIGKRDETVTAPPPATKTISRKEGQALNRTNFMSWAMDVVGDAAKVKKHFKSITRVPKPHETPGLAYDPEAPRNPLPSGEGMFLAGDAAQRFIAARKQFELEHPGYTFPDTGTAFEMRDLHQKRQPLGMLGHALGIAFDFRAAYNPNLVYGVNQTYAVKALGKHPGGKVRATMDLTSNAADESDPYKIDSKIQALGQRSVADAAGNANDAMAQRVYDQWQEMVATSEAMQANMAPVMDKLREARDAFFSPKTWNAEIAAAQAAKKKLLAKQSAKKPATAGSAGDADADPAAAAPPDPEVAKLDELIEDRTDKLKAGPDLVKRNLEEAFKSWNDEMQANIDRDQQNLDHAVAGLEGLDQIAGMADPKAQMAQLDEVAKQAGLPTLAEIQQKIDDAKAKHLPITLTLPTTPAAYKALLATKLGATKKYNGAEIVELKKWQARIKDPRAVFGSNGGFDKAAGHFRTAMVAEIPSLMQLFEHGFASNDAIPVLPDPPKPRAMLRQVFNAEVAKTLARFGWSPGATYGDNMHFDFIEGYNVIAKGGRSLHNVTQRTYGPKEPPPPPPPAKPAAAVPPGTAAKAPKK